MLQDNLKIKVRVKDLIKSLEDHKKENIKKYEKELDSYKKHVEKLSPKISKELRDLADLVDEGNLDRIKKDYNNKIEINLNLKINSKPNVIRSNKLDEAIGILKLSSDEFVTIKQSDYNSYFN